MPVSSIHRVTGLKVYFLPVQTRMPLKFGPETLTSATLLRVGVEIADQNKRRVIGWGETPLSVQWVWPSRLSHQARHEALKDFSLQLARAWMQFPAQGHALEAGYDFLQQVLLKQFSEFNQQRVETEGTPNFESMPWLAALVCNSAFDLALHDGFGKLADRPIYETYRQEFLRRDLSYYLEPAADSAVRFERQYPDRYLASTPTRELLAWHLVGGLDPLQEADLAGTEPQDGYPVLLGDWIQRDGLKCLKIKLRGTDHQWDYQRIVNVGKIAFPLGVEWLTADFNCTVREPTYVNEILDRLAKEHAQFHERILYVEQPFPYELEQNRIDVRSVSERKPLFLDESAHDWHMVRLGRQLGWTGVALKTCKTQTGAILSACWARAHNMQLMVQDLTNPMLAQISHVLLAAHVDTIMGVETNAMQFYPEASAPESKVHPGLYQRRGGKVQLSSISGPGFGYRLEEIKRELPEPALVL